MKLRPVPTWLTDTSLKQSGGTITNRHAYSYNTAHQRTKQTRTDGGYVDYLYEDVSQLYSAKTYTSGGAPVAAENRGYLYDRAWNVDARTNNATFYDDENQLVASEIPIYWRVEFTYDGKMRLRKKIDYTWDGFSWVWSAETRYLYDGMLVVQERNSANTPTVTYTRGTDLSGSLQGAGGIGGLLGRSHGYSSGSWSTHNHYHADGNGNITFLINSTQSIAASYKYDPFGNLITSSGTFATANHFRFSSKLFHPTSGLYYYGYRFYDPNLQRWMNRDPLQELGGINAFQYALNDPIGIIDSWGLCPKCDDKDNELEDFLKKISKETEKRIKEKLAESIGADIEEAKAACAAIKCEDSHSTLGNSWAATCQQCAALKCALDVKRAAAFEQCLKGTFVACESGVPPDKLKIPKLPK